MKVVFWDWDGVLISNLYLSDYYNLSINYNLNIENKKYLSGISKDLNPIWISHNWDLVLEFDKLNYIQIIVSNGSLSVIQEQLKYAVFNNFQYILTADYYLPKPNTQMFEFAQKKINFQFQNAYFFGDSDSDKEVGEKLKLKYYLLNHNFNNTVLVRKEIF